VSRRVVVTGIGLVSSLGIGNEANWTALLGGQSGIAPITRFDVSDFSTQIAGEVKGFDPLRFIEKKDVKKMDIFIQYAVAASQFAVDDSGLQITPANATRVGVFIASGIGGFGTIEREIHRSPNWSRYAMNGDPLPDSVVHDELHAGSASGLLGGENANSEIILHIPAGNGTPTAVSIPRDDWVDAQDGYVLAEPAMLALSAAVGKHRAHELVHRAALAGQEAGVGLAEALGGDPEIARHLSAAELAALLVPERALGAAGALVDDLLAER